MARSRIRDAGPPAVILGGLAVLVALGGTPPSSPRSPESPPRPPVLKEWPDASSKKVDFFSDGKALVIGHDGGLTIRDTITGKVRASISIADRLWNGKSFGLSPDGVTLATGGEKAVTLWDVSGRERATFRQDGPDPPRFHNHVNCLAFSPDGSILAAGDHAARVVLWEVATGRKLATLVGVEGRINEVLDRGHAASLAFAPDGKTLAVASDASSIIQPPRTLADLAYVIELWDVPSRTVRHATARIPGFSRGLTYSPDGQRIASAAHRGPVTLWDAATGRERASLGEHPAFIESLAFTPDGKSLALAGGYTLPPFIDKQIHEGKIAVDDAKFWSGEVRVWDVDSVTQRAAWRVHRHAVASVACSPDGMTLATASGEVRFWDAARLLSPKSP